MKRLIALFRRWWYSDEIEQRERRLRRIDEELKLKAEHFKHRPAKRVRW